MAKYIKVKARFLEDMLATANSDKEIHEKYIASKAPDALSKEEEVAAFGVDEVARQGKTIFMKDENGNPYFWNYQLKGFCKEACGMLKKCGKEEYNKASAEIRAHKKEIDGLVMVTPRKISLNMEGGNIGDCQRPLRVSGPQGERVALADSESVPEGTTFEFNIVVYRDNMVNAVAEWLTYAGVKGLGQWRNIGKGRFEILDATVEDYKVKQVVIRDLDKEKKGTKGRAKKNTAEEAV